MAASPTDRTLPTEITDWCHALAQSLSAYGHDLYIHGYLLGGDRVRGMTRRGHGDDRVVALGTLLEISGELGLGANDLLLHNRLYASAALVRQLIEVEYLLWAFAENDATGRKWLQADRDALLEIFAPSAIRKRARPQFDIEEYRFHCHLGGHPSPDAPRLLVGHGACGPIEPQWADLAVHLLRIWDRSVTVWESLREEDAVIPETPSLKDALQSKAGRSHQHVAPSDPSSFWYAVDPHLGRIEVGFGEGRR